MIISLTGFMGCGKSSVGRKLSELLCCPFTDLDAVIEEQEGRKIAEIFETDGEEEFRKIEARTLEHLIRKPATGSDVHIESVLALGGGAVMTPRCAEMVHEHTLCIYLRASADTLASHLEGEAGGRPLLKSSTTLQQHILNMMPLRTETYERTAHIIIDTDGKTINGIAEEINMSIFATNQFKR